MHFFLKKALTLLILTFVSCNSYAEDTQKQITIMTEVYPPYNMKVDGHLKGISVDVLEEMMKLLKTGQTRDDFMLSNWSRSYSMAEKRKNHMVFSTTRTSQREPLFKWVGPITKTTIGIMAQKKKQIVIKKLSDLNQYRVGTVLKDIGEQILKESGIDEKQLHSISGKNAIDLSFKKMKNDRIDMFAYELNAASYEAKAKGHNLDDFEVIYTLKEGELYYAFNKETDDRLIMRWQNALDTVKENGLFDSILKKY